MAGMLTNLLGGVPQTPEREDELQREQAYRYASLATPAQRSAYEIARAGQGMQEGIRGLVGAGLSMATGENVDLRSPGAVRAEKIAAVQREMANVAVDPNDPASLDRYIPELIRALGRHGLTAEAAEIMQEYQKSKAEQRRADIQQQGEDRKYQRDLAWKSWKDAEIAIRQQGTPDQKAKLYADVLTKLADPTISAEERSSLQGYARAYEGMLNIRERNGIRVVPSTKTQAGGSFQQQSDGSWKFVPESQMSRAGEGAGGEGEEGGDVSKGESGLKEGAKTKLSALRGLVANVRDAYAALTSNPDAVGPQNYLNKLASLWDRFDAEGLPVRASIADLGSALIQARSGAAVTDAEFVRLQPFVPQATDSAVMAVQKLQQMYRALGNNINAVRQVNGLSPDSFPALPPFNLPQGRANPPKQRSTDAQPNDRRRPNLDDYRK